jgi:prepilin-type N-terminal cleavage/methylation domain-containing protein
MRAQMIRRLTRADDERGFTLVELLVAMGVLLVVSTVILAGLVSALRATERGQARVDALTDLERAAERMARDLRFADPVDAASTAQVIVNVLRDDAGSQVRHRVTYDVAGGAITETRAIFDPPPSSVATSTTVRTVIEDLDPAATVFAFAKADGQPWVAGTDDLDDLAEFRLDLRRELPTQDPIELETSVFVRNVDDGR